MKHLKSAALAAILSFGTGLAAWATEPTRQHNTNALWFDNWLGLNHAFLTITAPNGDSFRVSAETGTPVLTLTGGEIQDGVYRYELRASTDEDVDTTAKPDNGREPDPNQKIFKPYNKSGHFFVSRGPTITPEEFKEEG